MSDTERLGAEIFVEGFEKFERQLKAADTLLDKTEKSFKGAGQGADSYSDDLNDAARSTDKMTDETSDMARIMDRSTDAMRTATTQADHLGDEVQQTGDQTEKAAQKTKSFGEKIKGAIKVIDQFKAASVILAGVAKKAFDFAEQGATIIQTSESFDILLESIGAAPDLLNRLQDAAGGTIPNMQLMSSVATLLAGAEDKLAVSLADATPRLLEIARAANKLNPSLGDTTFLFESIATGIKRGSPMILDNLGLVIKLGEANENYAQQLGVTVEELSNADKSVALLNATMEAGDTLIRQVGGSVDSATDSFARFKVKIQEDMIDPIMIFLAEGLTPFLDILTGEWGKALEGAIKDLEGFDGALEEMARTIQSNIFLRDMLGGSGDNTITTLFKMSDSFDEFSRAVDATAGPLVKIAFAQGNWTKETYDAAKASAAAASELDEFYERTSRMTDEINAAKAAEERLAMQSGLLARAIRTVHSATGDEAKALEILRAKFQGAARETEVATQKQKEMADQARQFASEAGQRLQEKLSSINQELRRSQTELGGFFASALEAGESSDNLTLALYEAAKQAGAGAKELALLAIATGEFSEAEVKAALEAAALQVKIGQLAQSIAEEDMGIPDAILALQRFKNEMDNIPREIITEIKVKRIGPTGEAPPEAYQMGGPVFPGAPIVVGENGPEMFTPATGGSILPNQSNFTDARQFNLTTQSVNRPSTLALEFQAMEYNTR